MAKGRFLSIKEAQVCACGGAPYASPEHRIICDRPGCEATAQAQDLAKSIVLWNNLQSFLKQFNQDLAKAGVKPNATDATDAGQ